MKLDGVIFDLDGTLVDSEGIWFKSDRQFVESFGGVYDDAFRAECVGMGARSFCVLIKEKLGLKQDLEELLEFKDKLYLEAALGEIKAFPEMIKLVRALEVEKMPMAVASGSTLKVIEAVLKDVGLRQHFDHVYSSDMVANAKPAPDIFLMTGEKMGIKPHNALVFEDSSHGVTAAKSAGMRVVAVPFVWTEKGRAIFDRADLLFPNGMADFTAEAVLEWIDGFYCQCEDCTLYEYGRCND